MVKDGITGEDAMYEPVPKFRKLHKVVWKIGHDGNGPTELDYYLQDWLVENCKYAHYTSPGWCVDKFVEFADETDAALFALHWVGRY